ncbi:mannosyl-3-phosphoglycerate synthase [Colletotrichum truncatum]|uniref:Mannosyl-3-phosphoglycerate synthase n=1 Tax=Colletotrichum truncatum TaxID=5467 RepID=A0ACC3Z0L2_COLTU
MRPKSAIYFEQFGSVRIHELQRVVELDARSDHNTSTSSTVSKGELFDVEAQMAMIILCINEEYKIID